MSSQTPKPPYTFPQQKPTAESVDEDGDILIQYKESNGFFFHSPDFLKGGDVWVPGCFEFFDDWGSGEHSASARIKRADASWGSRTTNES